MTRFAAVVEAATATDLEGRDDEDKATATLYIQKAAQAPDEVWQRRIGGLQGPNATNPTMSEVEHSSSASQDDDDSDFEHASAPRKGRLSAPQLQAQLSPLYDRTRLRRLKTTLYSNGA